MAIATGRLPSDARSRLGGLLFLVSLLIFFLASLLLYGLVAWAKPAEMAASLRLPAGLWASTICLLSISGLLHAATRSIRRERRQRTASLVTIAGFSATFFLWVQFLSMRQLLAEHWANGGWANGDWANGDWANGETRGSGLAGMVVVLAFLHAVHVAGGIAALGFVVVGALRGRYDHERHWPVAFTAHYWHFLDAVWLCMLGTFWLTTGGFAL